VWCDILKKKLLLIGIVLVFLLALPFATAGDLDDATVYYSFDDVDLSGSNPDDLSINGNDGTNEGADTGQTGILGEAFDYIKANTDRVDFPTGLITGSSDRTVCLWAKPDAVGTSNYLFGIGTASANEVFGAQFTSINDLTVVGWSGEDRITGYTLPNTNWAHYCFTVESNSLKTYVNGGLEDTWSHTYATGSSFANIGKHPSASSYDFDGLIDEFVIYDFAITLSQVGELYNSGNGYNPYALPPSGVNESAESTSIVKQVNDVIVNNVLTTITSSSFEVLNDATPIYGGYSFKMEATQFDNELYCELEFNGTVIANITRDNTVDQLGNGFKLTPIFVVDKGIYTRNFNCKKLSGSPASRIIISDGVGVNHLLVDEHNNTLPYNYINVSKNVTSGVGYTLIDSFNITTGLNNRTDNLTNHIIIEGDLSYTNNGVVSELPSTYMSVAGINCTFYPRTVDVGKTGSVGIDCIATNVTHNTTYTINVYGNGTDFDYDGLIIAKSFFVGYDEVVGGTGAATGLVFSGDSDNALFSAPGGNAHHAISNVFTKASVSLTSDKDSLTRLWITIVNGSTYRTINFSRFLAAGETGVLIGQDIIENLPLDTYNTTIWGNCGTSGANCTFSGGQTGGYITDVTTTIVNAFNVTSYNVFDNVSIQIFNVTNGGVVSSVAGVANIFSSHDLINLTISSNGYFDKVVINHNTSINLNVSLTPLYYLGDVSYTGFTNYSGVFYSNNISYGVEFLCPVGESRVASLVVDGVVFDSFSVVCNNNLVNNVGSFVYDFEGSFDSFFNWTGNSAVTSNFSVTWDLFRPSISQSFTSGIGFNNNTINIEVTCTDTVSPIVTYNISWVGVLVNYSNQTSGTTINFNENASIENYVYTVCTDLAGNVRTNNFSQTVYSTTFFLVNEQDGTFFDVNNLSSVVVYIDDNSTSLDLKSLGSNNFSFTSTGNDILRFEYIYGDGFIINRYFDMSFVDSVDTRFCAIPDGNLQFYEQIVVSSIDTTRVSLEASFADCIVFSDTTRFAYQNAFSIRTFTIDTTYVLYNYLSGNVKAILASIDGGIEAFINVDSLVFSSGAFNQGLRAESLTVEKFSDTTMLILYNNTNEDNAALSVVLTRQDTGAIVYSEDEFDNVNSFILYYDFSALTGLENDTLFKVVVENVREDGTSSRLSRFFNTAGKTGIINPKIAFLFVFLMLIFGITFPTASDALSWFGMFLCIGNLGIIAASILTEGLGFLLAVNGVVMIYIIIIMVNQTSQKVAT